jgi:hypothetical protein
MIPTSSETLTIGIILLFLFGAISFYLYSRITQIEKKMSLLENILLDLKVATESSIATFPIPDEITHEQKTQPYIYSYHTQHIKEPIDINNQELVIEQSSKPNQPGFLSQGEFYELEEVEDINEFEEDNQIDTIKSVEETSNSINEIKESIPDEKQVNVIQTNNTQSEQFVSVNKTTESPYDNMTVKELQVIAKAKGISVSGLKRVQMIDILKQNDLNKVNNDVIQTINELPTISEIFNSGEGGEVLPMDAPSSLLEASPIDN